MEVIWVTGEGVTALPPFQYGSHSYPHTTHVLIMLSAEFLDVLRQRIDHGPPELQGLLIVVVVASIVRFLWR